jgi:hypothetical protein
MQKLEAVHGYPKVKRALRYTGIRLRSRPETQEMSKEVDAERAKLDSANEAYEQLFEERVALTALIDYLDSLVDGGVMAIARDVSVITGNKTDDPFYKLLFPVAPSTATAPVASDSQTLFVKALIDRIETDSRYESLRPRAAALKTAQADLERALKDREDLRTPMTRAALDLQAALENGKRMYNKLLPRLSLTFDKPSYVETFFSKLRKSKGAVDPDTEEVGDEETAAPNA